MKRLLVLSLYFICSYYAYADCALNENGFVQHVQTENFADSEGLVWIGEKIDETIDEENFIRVIRMSVIEVWCADIKYSPDDDSPSWAFDYLNTDDEIFIIAPYGSSQDFTIPEGPHVIASVWVGAYYAISPCANDLLAIDENTNSVTGYLHELYTTETLTIPELEEEIIEDPDCVNSIGSGLSNRTNALSVEALVHPNPSNGKFYVTLSQASEAIEIRISSINGQRVLYKVVSGDYFEIDLSELESGVYFMDLVSEEFAAHSSELVKF